jgi:hypothetical protein
MSFLSAISNPDTTAFEATNPLAYAAAIVATIATTVLSTISLTVESAEQDSIQATKCSPNRTTIACSFIGSYWSAIIVSFYPTVRQSFVRTFWSAFSQSFQYAHSATILSPFRAAIVSTDDSPKWPANLSSVSPAFKIAERSAIDAASMLSINTT